MSQAIENRIVEMQFENKQFESGVQESLSTLDKLKKALKFEDSAKNLQEFSKATKNFDLNGIGNAVEQVGNKFSTMRLVGIHALNNIVDSAMEAGKRIANVLSAPMEQIKKGGWARAMNIEDAKFQLKGLGIAWEEVSSDIDYAVKDTAFGLDAAAKACAQLSASGVQAGEDMKAALRGISGVAAMGNTEYENIADIFTKAAGNGKVMADELNRISQYGLNASATMKDFFNAIADGDEKVADVPDQIKDKVMALTKGLHVSEEDIRKFASSSKISFDMFARAMDGAFGEHAKKANETFMGSLRNIKAALSRTGEKFAAPFIKDAIPVLNKVRELINAINSKLGNFTNAFSNITKLLSDSLVSKLGNALDFINNKSQFSLHMYRSLQNIVEAVLRVFVALGDAFREVFPETKSFGDRVNSLGEGIENFTKKLIPSNETLIIFKTVMSSVFTVIKAVGTLIKALLPIITKIAQVAAFVINIIAKVVAGAINLVSQLNLMDIAFKAVEIAIGLILIAINKLRQGFEYLRTIFSDTTTITGQFAAAVRDSIMTVVSVIGGVLFKVGEFVTNLIRSSDPLKFLIDSFKNLINTIKETSIIGNAINYITDAFRNLLNIFSPVQSSIDKTAGCVKTLVGVTKEGEQVIEEVHDMAMAYGSGPAMAGVAKELTKAGDATVEATSKMEKSKGIIATMAKLWETLSEKLHGLKASSVILAIFAMRLVMFAYNTDQLIISLTKLTRKLSGGFLNLFKTPLTKFAKFSGAMIQIAAAIGILAYAFYKLKDVPVDKLKEITKTLGLIIGMVAGLSLLSTLLVGIFTRWSGGEGFSVFGINVLALSSSLLILLGALKMLDSMDLKTVEKDVIVLGVIMAGLLGVSAVMSKLDKLASGSLRLIAFAAATLILVKSLDNLSQIDFTAIKQNWKEIIAVLLGFSAVAAIASTVGLSSLIGLVAFFLGFNTIAAVMENVKKNLEGVELGEFILEFCSRLKNTLAQLLVGIRDFITQLSSVQLILITAAIIVTSIMNISIISLLNKVTKYIRRVALSVVLMAGSIAALMYAYFKVAQACQGIDPGTLQQVKETLALIGVFLAILSAIGLAGGDSLTDKSSGSGKNKTKELLKNNRSNYMKQIRKMLFDMAILIASIALFMHVVGKLTPDELQQAKNLLLSVALFVGTLMILITLLTTQSQTASNTNSIFTFIGIVMLFGALIASFVVLMNYFKDLETKDIGLVIGTIAILGIFVHMVNSFLATLGNMQFSGGAVTLAAFALVIAAIGGVVWLLATSIDKNNIKIAIGIAAALLVFIGILAWLTVSMNKGFRSLYNIPGQGKNIYTALFAIAAIIAVVGLIAIALIHTINKENWPIAAAVAASITVFITILVALAKWLQKSSIQIEATGIGKGKLIATILALVAAVGVLALAIWALKDETQPLASAGANFINAATIIAALVALIMIAKYTTMFAKSVILKDLAVAAGIIGAMEVFFLAMAGIFKLIDSYGTNAGQLLGKSQTIVLVILELGVLAGAITFLGTILQEMAIEAGIGAGAMAVMIGFFALITLVFKMIDGLHTNAEELSEKTRTIKNAMWELIGMFAVITGIGFILSTATEFIGALGALVGAGFFAIMLLMFNAMAEIFETIDGLKVDGLEKKSRIIRNVMWELIGITAVSIVAVLGIPGIPSMMGMVEVFRGIAEVFVIIDAIKIEGLEDKTRIIRNVMWELIGLATVLGLVSPIAAAAALGVVGIKALIEAMVGITMAFNMLDTSKLAEMQTAADMMTELLWKLTAIGAVNGAFGFIGEGLISISEGIVALGNASVSISAGITTFAASIEVLTVAITNFCTTGEQINAWFTNVGSGIEQFCISIVTTIATTGMAIVQTVDGIITSIANAIFGGGPQIYSASQEAGGQAEEGFKSKTAEANTWGLDLIQMYASGITGGIGSFLVPAVAAAAKTVWSYLHFSGGPEEGPIAGNSVFTWGTEVPLNFGNGILSGIPNGLVHPLQTMATTTKTGLEVIVSEGKKKGAEFIQKASSAAQSMMPNWDAQIDHMMNGIFRVNNALANMYSSYNRGLGTLADFDYGLTQRIKQQNDATKRLENAYNRTGRSSEALDAAIKKSSESAKKLTDQQNNFRNMTGSIQDMTSAMDDFTSSVGGGGKGKGGGGGATQALEDFGKKLSDTLNSQMDIFSKFEKKQAMSKDELLANMRSQIQGMAEWANDMKILAAKGIDKGLYEKLAMMGPQGAEYVGAFKEMTAEELAEANQLWAQSLVLPDQVAGEVAGAFNSMGSGVLEGLNNGLNGPNRQVVLDSLTQLGGDMVTTFHDGPLVFGSPSETMRQFGEWLNDGLHDGLSATMERPISIMRIICETIYNTAKRILDPQKFYEIGKNIVLGLVRGLNDAGARSALNAAISGLSEEMQAATEALNEIQSPSKVYYRYGRYIVMGLANGISENSELATSAIKDMNQSNLDTMRETIRSIGDMVTEEMSDPVIKPVLDLTNVSSGMRTLSNLFSTNQALSASASMNLQNGQINGVVGNTVFNQYNYSPKALSRSEIYRQTKNQFSAYREAFR